MSKTARWILLLVAMTALAWVLKAGLIAFGGYVLIGVYLLSRYLAKAWITNLAAEQILDTEPCEVGDSVEFILRLRNTGTLPIAWVFVEAMLPEQALKQRPPRLTVKGSRLRVLFLRPLQTVSIKLTLTFAARGYYPIGPGFAETGDVFGLHRRHRRLTPPAYIMVYPKALPLPNYNFASTRPIGEIRLANRLFEDPTRSAGVRPYMLGDPLQRIHWRATARTGELHSRIYEPTSLAGATLLVDFHRDGFPTRGEPYRSELAITATCSLAYALSMLNQQIGLASNGRDAAERIRDEAIVSDDEAQPAEGDASRFEARERFEPLDRLHRLRPVVVETRRGFDQYQRIREALARLELTDGMTFAELVLEMGPRLPKDATILAILPRVPVETSLALGILRRQGFAISAILIGIADDGSDDRAQGYGRLLAEGIRDVRFVNSEEELMMMGERSAVAGPATYNVSVDLA